MTGDQIPYEQQAEILVADDNPSHLQLLNNILKEHGYRVRPASGGVIALRSVKAKVPDLILLDVRMSDIDGFEICKRLKADETTCGIPVIFISAMDDTAGKVEGFKAGGVDYITKPFEAEEVLARVGTQLRLHELTEHLEEQVRKRTAQLSTANQQLKNEIEERKRTQDALNESERRLRHAQKMEAIGTLAGGIAHDFNNILYIIMGMSELLLDALPLDSQEYKNVKSIFMAGIRGSDLVKQIIAFSRQSENEMILIKIQPILRDSLRMSRSTIPANIEITHSIQEDCGPIMADPTQLYSIVMNLITNAYHALDQKGGKISVQLKKETLDDAYYAMLTVSDTGCGIDPLVRDKIFDPYFTTKDQGKGTGLGLAVVYGIVKKYGGDIRVRTEVGRGTDFDVYFPFSDKTQRKNELTENTDTDTTSSERILVVDDEDAVICMEKLLLEKLGYKVAAQTGSIQALELFKSDPYAFDLVITDMTMPDMTGDRLAREVKAIRPDIPVILCTGFSERIDEEKAEAMGIEGFLMKPVRKSVMANMIRKVLDY